MRTLSSRLFLSLSIAFGAVGAHALNFNITSTGNAQVDAGFQAAADLWEAEYLDPITININAVYRNFNNPNVIGQAGSARVGVSYQGFRTALIADAIYPENGTDPQVIASLPNTTGVAWQRRNVTNDSIFLDNDGSANNTSLAVNRANAKALGLVGANDATTDATIEFNSGFSFDFDRSNGINGTQVDFIGVAFHEIGHALGFVSGVDTYDVWREFDPTTSRETSLNGSAVFTPLDLLRYSSSSPGVRNVAYGVESYLSLNGGGSNNGAMSTGAYNGDFRQASHWKDNDITGIYLGALDPTLADGQLVQFSVFDGAALDAIGYDVVPEPATFLALGAGAAALASRRRRRKS